MDNDVSDRELVHRAKEGDFGAFDALVTRHEQQMYSLAMSILRQSQDAQDAVQTGLIQALEGLAGFREEASFKTWLTRIVSNAALKILRRRRGLPTVSLDEALEAPDDDAIPHPHYVADWRYGPERLVARAENRRLLAEALLSLDEKYRLVFLLRDVHGLSTRDTAASLEISEANVKVRLLRARLALREQLTRAFGDPHREISRAHSHGDDEATVGSAARLTAAYELESGGK